LKKGKGSCVNATKSLGTWPETIGIKEKERKGQSFPKISLKY